MEFKNITDTILFCFWTFFKKTLTINWILLQLLEKLLQSYICTWYSDLSSNKAFVQQLRLAITTATRNIASRLLNSNIPEIVFNNLVPVAIQHAQDWEELKKRSKDLGGSPRDHVADYFGNKIHAAAYSRQAELDYLRGIATTLTPILLPTTHISTNNRVKVKIANFQYRTMFQTFSQRLQLIEFFSIIEGFFIF